MKKNIFFLLLLLGVQWPVRAQFWGLSVNPDIDTRVQFPLNSYPFKTGMVYSAKVSVNMHFFYVFRAGVGVGFNHFSHPLYVSAFHEPGLKKVKTGWNNLCIPVHFMACIPIRNQVMPMVQFQSNLMLPQNIYQVETYEGRKIKKPSVYQDDLLVENNLRMGALVRNDDRTQEMAIALQFSFTRSRQQDLRFFGIGLSFQYFFMVASKGLKD